MAVNATGVFLGTKYAIEAMLEAGGGSIINISSIYGIVGSEHNAAYHASKGAVRTFSKSAAAQYAREGIRVNSVHPGFVDSPMTQPIHSDPERAAPRLAQTPMGCFGQPIDIANGCLFLALRRIPLDDRGGAGDRRRDDRGLTGPTPGREKTGGARRRGRLAVPPRGIAGAPSGAPSGAMDRRETGGERSRPTGPGRGRSAAPRPVFLRNGRW